MRTPVGPVARHPQPRGRKPACGVKYPRFCEGCGHITNSKQRKHRKWHTESGYSKRSKVETTFHRYKAIVGSAMRARGLAVQRVEARIGCKILNTMTVLGMPDSEMIG